MHEFRASLLFICLFIFTPNIVAKIVMSMKQMCELFIIDGKKKCGTVDFFFSPDNLSIIVKLLLRMKKKKLT